MKSRSEQKDFTEVPVKEVIEQLDVDKENGLSSTEAESRQEKYGKNEIESEKRKPVIEFLAHFWGPIPWMIEVAVVLSAIAGRWEDFAVIFTMLLINGGVGFWHESKASNAIETLKEKMSPESIVIRDGDKITLPSKELVPGDVIVLKMGNIVPADAKLIPDQQLSIDESVLTGESLPVDKEGDDNTFSGTSVKRGEAKGIVIATGNNTQFARTVELVEKAEEKSHFQKAVLRIGYFLIGITAVLVAGIIVAGIIRNEEIMEVLLFALVVTIAGIPQALPAVMSVTMTVGANRLARKKAIVSRLSAMEEMAGLEILFADKTGTLTKNELTLKEPVLIDGGNEEEIIQIAALTTKKDHNDPIDEAILNSIDWENELEAYEILEFKGFDPTRKRADAKVKKDGEEFWATKGAPQVILELTNPSEEKAEKINNKIEEKGREGFRTLGVAKKVNDKWMFLGLLTLFDPPREDTKEIIKKAKDHGIDIRMITGDHIAIARQVDKQLDLNNNIIHAHDFFDKPGDREDEDKNENHNGKEEKNKHQHNKVLLKDSGFAEVTPEHKFKLIKEFQSQNKIVGMTGDGVNDAPALKQADVGIAVSNATDAARSASSLVLTQPGLGVINSAIEEARRIFERMTGYATFRITESLRVLLFLTLSIIAFEFYPVTPIMVVLLAILNDIPIMTIAYDNVPTASKPVRWNMKRVLTISSVLSIGGVISSFIFFWYFFNRLGWDKETIQTMIFLKLLVAGHMTIFLTRNNGWMWQKPYPNWLLFVTIEATQVIGTLVAVYGWLIHPIGWVNAGIVWGYAIVWLLVMNVIKVMTIKIINKSKQL